MNSSQKTWSNWKNSDILIFSFTNLTCLTLETQMFRKSQIYVDMSYWRSSNTGMGFPFKTHLKSKSSVISFAHTHASVDQSFWNFAQSTTDSITTMLCAKFQNDWTIETNVMDERDFARFEFKTSFWRISHIAVHSTPGTLSSLSRYCNSLFEYQKLYMKSMGTLSPSTCRVPEMIYKI